MHMLFWNHHKYQCLMYNWAFLPPPHWILKYKCILQSHWLLQPFLIRDIVRYGLRELPVNLGNDIPTLPSHSTDNPKSYLCLYLHPYVYRYKDIDIYIDRDRFLQKIVTSALLNFNKKVSSISRMPWLKVQNRIDRWANGGLLRQKFIAMPKIQINRNSKYNHNISNNVNMSGCCRPYGRHPWNS